MPISAVFHEEELVVSAPPASRADVLGRYRQLREIARKHNHRALSLLAREAIFRQARRLGLARGKTLLLDDMDELFYAYDLAIYTAPPGRSRAIDRLACSVSLPTGSDEALMLEAMCNDCFALVIARRRHELAGLIVTDVARDQDVWLVDEGLEKTFPDGAGLALRYWSIDGFAMTAGVGVPFAKESINAALAALPRSVQSRSALAVTVQDRRFAEGLYRAAIAGDLNGTIRYQQHWGDVDEDP